MKNFCPSPPFLVRANPPEAEKPRTTKLYFSAIGPAFIVIFCLLILFAFPTPILAQELAQDTNNTYPATITKILEQKDVTLGGKLQKYQKIELRIDSGDQKNNLVVTENGTVPVVHQAFYKTGDRVMIMSQKDLDGRDVFFITDFIRTNNLLYLTAAFVLATLAIGRKSGFKSLLGMAFSFFVIFKFVLPQLLGGADPIWVIFLASLVVIPSTFYLAHGLNKKTTVSIIGTFIALVITALLANYFVSGARLSGYASEEVGFLQVAKEGSVNVKGLLLAGILIGAFGILNDITISQASVVEQLKKAAEKTSTWDLYKKAMNVGQDHIASMVNTLVLVYAGSALPLLLLFVNNPHPVMEVINYEIVAEEIVKTLLSSTALILAVPLTTLLASLAYTKTD